MEGEEHGDIEAGPQQKLVNWSWVSRRLNDSHYWGRILLTLGRILVCHPTAVSQAKPEGQIL